MKQRVSLDLREKFPRLVDFYNFTEYDFRAVITSNKGKYSYGCMIGPDYQYCGCAGYQYNKRCYHLKELTEIIKSNGEYIPMNENKYKVSINAINQILDGGLPAGTLTAIFGKSKRGKTTSSIWAMMDIMNQTGKNSIFLDSETGLATEFVPDLVKRFNKRNKTDIGIKHLKINYRKWMVNKDAIIPYNIKSDDEKEQQVVVVDVPNLQSMFLLMGRPYKIDMDSAKPKLQNFSTNLWQNIWDIPLAQLLDDPQSEDEYCGFVVDSMTNLMSHFGSNTQALPVRHDAQIVIMNQLQQLLSEYDDMVGINIFHGSSNPQKQNEQEKYVGGKSVGHGHKTIIHFDGLRTEGLNTIVTIKAYRLPTKLGEGKSSNITINDNGVF